MQEEKLPILRVLVDVAECGVLSMNDLAVNAVKGLDEKSAVLIANHGVAVHNGQKLERIKDKRFCYSNARTQRTHRKQARKPTPFRGGMNGEYRY